MGRTKAFKVGTIHINICNVCKKTIRCNNEKFADKMLLLHEKLKHPENKTGLIKAPFLESAPIVSILSRLP